ncbi:hypothetical protein GGR50DRAFT_666429 [Xylaria sp. CBS 124048]|nr:hypothetical protein GGR50DRAFT_666429 [Xylaria sp. CBS 124048]
MPATAPGSNPVIANGTTKGPVTNQQHSKLHEALPLRPRLVSIAGKDVVDGHTNAKEQLSLLRRPTTADALTELSTAPLFSYAVLDRAQKLSRLTSTPSFSQYGLLAGDARSLEGTSPEDPRIYYNVATPSSVFICGSQGSGKSHTLSCILENCLIQSSKLGDLPHPLTGLVFHYDNYASDSHVSPCEAAYLSSNPAIKVRVLCAPTNIRVVKESYSGLSNVTVEPLRLDQAELNTKRMLELMAFDPSSQPLYVQVIQRILREMRLDQQEEGNAFSYQTFTNKLGEVQFMGEQKRALQQRLDTLESFMVPSQAGHKLLPHKPVVTGTHWAPKAGELIIVDLTCPCVTAPAACALFNICLSIFLEQDSKLGRIIALDEAHRYMGESSECKILTESLLAAVRFQRHLGARIVISTQEPTISPKLLDLCNITIVHRFSSPDWLNVLTKHLAGISKVAKVTSGVDDETAMSEEEDTSLCGLRGISVSPDDPILDLFAQIVELHTGEALVFAPNAVVSMKVQTRSTPDSAIKPKKLAHHVLRVVVRARITEDGGRSIMAA